MPVTILVVVLALIVLLVAVMPEAAMQIVLAAVWLAMGLGVLYSIGKALFF